MGLTRRQNGRLPSSGTLTQIFQAAVQDEPGGVDQLFAAYRPLLLHLAARRLQTRLQPKAGPSDLVQLTEWKARENFATQQFTGWRRFHAWVLTILDNQVATVGRHFVVAKKRDITRERPISGPEANQWLRRLSARLTAHDRQNRAETFEEVMLAFRALPPHYQLILRLRYFEMLSFASIGEKLERPAEATRMLHNRAIRRLRDTLAMKRQEESSSA